MFAVEGIFDGTAVRLNTAELPVKERYRVVVTFLNQTENALDKKAETYV